MQVRIRPNLSSVVVGLLVATVRSLIVLPAFPPVPEDMRGSRDRRGVA
jgi:hypothetical protein